MIRRDQLTKIQQMELSEIFLNNLGANFQTSVPDTVDGIVFIGYQFGPNLPVNTRFVYPDGTVTNAMDDDYAV